MESIRLLQFGSSHLMGLTAQESELSFHYNKNIADFVVVSGENEQFPGLRKKLIKNGITHVIINNLDHHKFFFRNAILISKIINKYNINIVTVNTNWHLLIISFAALFTKFKFKKIYTLHGYRHNNYFKSKIAYLLISLELLFFCDIVNLPSSFLFSKFWIIRHKSKSIPLGEDDFFYSYSRNKISFENNFRFIFPAVFRDGKNHKLIIDSFSKFMEITNLYNSRLILPGVGPNFNEIINYISTLGLNQYISCPGQLSRSEIAECYASSNVALMASNVETFGHAIIEPMIFGNIVISRITGVAKDAIQDGHEGFLFNQDADLLIKMLHLTSLSEKKLLEISQNAKKKSLDFKWDAIVKRHISELFCYHHAN